MTGGGVMCLDDCVPGYTGVMVRLGLDMMISLVMGLLVSGENSPVSAVMSLLLVTVSSSSSSPVNTVLGVSSGMDTVTS